MDFQRKNRLMDLIEDIKEVDAMIKLHSENNSAMMLDQYKYKKEKLISYLIEELVEPDLRSARSMFLIKVVIERFYPNIQNDAEADLLHQDLNDLRAVLA